MLNNAEQDAANRKRAAAGTGESFIVQAPAGSGKTELLIQRYLALLAQVSEPEAVVAITFTKKAAGEMRDRVLKSLRSAGERSPKITSIRPESEHQRQTMELAEAVCARSQQRGWNLLDTSSRLRIQTIDSFCFSLVEQRPLLSRLGTSRQVLEQAQAEQAYLEAAYGTIRLLASEKDRGPSPRRDRRAIARVLAHRDANVAAVAALLASMLKRRDQWQPYLRQNDPAALRVQFESLLAQIVGPACERARRAIEPVFDRRLVALVRFAAGNLLDQEKPISRLAGLQALPAGSADELETWRILRMFLLTQGGDWRKAPTINDGFPRNCEEKEEFKQLVSELGEESRQALLALDELPSPVFIDAQWEVLEALLLVLPLALEQLRLVFQQAGAVDYIQIAQGAIEAFGIDPEQRIEHLLVDEFQDTSVSQWRLLCNLTKHWRPGDGRTLFLVGDPMQSVYRFRQAEVGVFLRARQSGLGHLPLTPLTLSLNFRSDRALVEWFNAVFPRIFPKAEDVATGAVPYTECLAARDGAARIGCYRAFDRKDEAGLLVEVVRRQRALSPDSSIAVLVRARTHLPDAIAALRQAGITFQAVEIENLADRVVVRDLLSLTRALLHPADRIAWLALLRAPWCGLTLADLHALCGAEPSAAIWELLNRDLSGLSPDGRIRVERLRAVLAPALEQRRRLPLRQWVEGAWIALGGPACLRESTDIENAACFFDLLQGIESAGELADFDHLEAELGELFAQPEAEANLQVMTIHKAKGLQFDAVIIPGLGRKPRHEDPPLMLWEERAGTAGPELLLAPISEKGAAETDPIYRYLWRTEAARKKEEVKRLLYVAVTRARHALHLIAEPNLNRDGSQRDNGSLLYHLWPVLQEEFVAAPHQFELVAEDPVQPPSRSPRVLLRLPAAWELPKAPPSVDWSGGQERAVPSEAPVSYDWVGESTRRIGTVVHSFLQRIASEGLDAWSVARVASSRPLFAGALANLGFAGPEIEKAVPTVANAITKMLTDDRGRWLLAPHLEALNECGYSGVLEDQLCRIQPDRTFIDENGVRWIVDYKTSPHQGGDLEEFLDNERERYREQLERYAHLLARLDDRPIRVGIYFPLQRGWRSWQVR